MQVVALDRPWLGTPFLLQGFEVRTEAEVLQLQEWSQTVEVLFTEALRGVDLSARSQAAQPTAARLKRAAVPDRSKKSRLDDELREAEPLHDDALQVALSVYDAVAAGRPPNVAAVRNVVTGCVASILRNPGALQLLSRLRDSDRYTSEHSLNVALLAIGVGRHMGLEERELYQLGMAGMLHDVGKMHVPNEVLNKPSKLDADEARIMRDHARMGFEILQSSPRVPKVAIDVAHSHHEAQDGSGYPRGLTANQISDYTSLVTLCDVYDAIISDRPYKKGRSSLDALRVLNGLRGTQFHDVFTGDFINSVGLYPLGSIVELQSGEIGVVMAHTEFRHLPCVLLMRDADHQPIDPRPVDLRRSARSSSKARLIRNVLGPGACGIDLRDCIAFGLAEGIA